METKSKQKRGMAAASPETRARVASIGGKAAHASGRAHKLTIAERRRGGQNTQSNFKNRSNAEVAELGRKGGQIAQETRKSLTGSAE